ncbi:protein phosphatase 2C 70 [Ipomoea triloba]|uniref:protein phosphatase 2C 70 n=1 Tax=Ipomoea triloba TaxID=35885 RepID=UPI00125DFF19|nr:protein phosphatase 2C 70 [Ipomoea triloba]
MVRQWFSLSLSSSPMAKALPGGAHRIPLAHTTVLLTNIAVSVEALLVFAVVMLLLILLFILLACKFKPWRFLSSAAARSRTAIKAEDVERPLITDDFNLAESLGGEFSRGHTLESSGHHAQGSFDSPRTHGLVHKPRLPSTTSHLTHSDSFVLDIGDTSEDAVLGQTLKGVGIAHFHEEQRRGRNEDTKNVSRFGKENEKLREFVPKYTTDQRSVIMLEVIAGPSCGLQYSIQSSNTSKLPFTLGRVPPSDVTLKDSEVSGKHAQINWNINKLKWELVDMGSLNGTLVNSRLAHNPHLGNRQWGDPVELANGDVITFGTSSKLLVQVTSQSECHVPFGVGLASDPMSLRRGAKKLPMEDVSFYQWPLPGTDQFGLFGICDGHGGASAAESASKILPQIVASILSDSFRREEVLSQCDASDVLREAFSQAEASLNHNYEGCTATMLLVWADGQENFYAQCANVGDSACVVNIDGKQIKMTEDHRITSNSEKLRFEAAGEPLKDGETRLCGLNLARMLGDKFLKQQDVRFSSEPYISHALYIHQTSTGFALLASDGFWDVIHIKKAVQLVQQCKERSSINENISAEKIANVLLNEAKTLRTKDNTSIIFLDFDTNNRIFSNVPEP